MIAGSKSQSQFLQNIDKMEDKKHDNDQKQEQVKPSQNINAKFARYKFLYCWVGCESYIGKRNEFNFNFSLWIRSKDDPVIFQMNYKTLRDILKRICEKTIYFAVQKLPKSMPKISDH